MQILIVPAVAVRSGGLVYPGEIRVVDYKEHVKEVCRLGALPECAQGDLNQAMKIRTYDEAKERELFERFWSENMNTVEMDLHRHIYPMNSGWSYACHETNRSWMTWQACAKSRAGIQP